VKLLNRVSIATLVLLVGLMPFGLWAVVNVPIGSADTHSWLPEGRVERQRYEQFLKDFGSDQVLLASWDGATLDDPRAADFIESVVSPLELIASLEQPPLNLKHVDAVSRFSGTMVGDNGTIAVVINVSQLGASKHQQTIDLVRKLADSVPGLGRDRLKLVGSVYESYAIDKAAEKSLAQLVIPSTVLALLVSWVCVKSFRAICLVMLLAGSGQLVSVAVVYYGGYEFSAVMIVLPTLVFMLTLSGAVHLVNYFLDARSRDPNACGLDALKRGWRPCVLSSVTTMLGMGSLLSSELYPVRQFGYLSAVCLGIATVLLLLAFPAIADLLFGFDQFLNKWRKKNQDPTLRPERKLLCIPLPARLAFLKFQFKFANAISLASLILLGVAAIGLFQLESSTKSSEMFPKENPTRQDMVWFERNIGPIATIEVLLRFPKDAEANLLDQAKQVVHLTNKLKHSKPVGGAFSAATFFPELTDAKGMRATTIRAAQKRNLEANIDKLAGKGVFSQTMQETVWRISARVPAVSTIGYGEMAAEVGKSVSLTLDDYATDHSVQRPKVELTGLYPVLHETQVTLLSDLGSSFLSAYLLITPVMILLVRSFWGGLLIMIPNILPIALALGVMGLCGWTLDIAGVLTTSVALGIAVDDTLHFTCWYINDRKSSDSAEQSVTSAFHGCSAAMIHTTLICSCSMFPFLFADFIPTQQFAILMISILVLAVLADLILLPALLLSPAGRVIAAKRK
jgi:uncharacterized protein